MANDRDISLSHRRPGGQPGNRNALKHGNRAAKAIAGRKLRCARTKSLLLLGVASGVWTWRNRVRPRALRVSQLALLHEHEPEIAAYLSALGLDIRPAIGKRVA